MTLKQLITRQPELKPFLKLMLIPCETLNFKALIEDKKGCILDFETYENKDLFFTESVIAVCEPFRFDFNTTKEEIDCKLYVFIFNDN